MLTPDQAFDIASSWASAVRSCDPGACFYGFPTDGRGRGDGRPADEEHRAACLAYCEDLITKVVNALNERILAKDLGWTKRDLSQLRSLRRFFRETETREKRAKRREAFDKLDSFTRAYITAALWSSTDDSDESGGEPLDSNYGPEDLAPETLARMVEDCATFRQKHAALLKRAGDEEQNGHDFWLTRNGHGAGFWDRGYRDGVGTALTDASDTYGGVDLYLDDDGKIYGS